MTTRAVFSTGSFASVVRMSAKPSATHWVRDSSTENQPDRGVLAFAARLHAVRIDAVQEIGQSIRKRLFLEEEEALPDPDIRQWQQRPLVADLDLQIEVIVGRHDGRRSGHHGALGQG